MSLLRGAPIIEVKLALDGLYPASPARRFTCELLEARSHRVVVLYRFDLDGRAIESYGVFWRRRAYNCYYAVPAASKAGGAPAFVRFDVVRDVQFALDHDPPEVRYTDLLLDLWVDSAGARWEDTEEVTAALEAGALSPSDARTIEKTRSLLDAHHRRIISEVRSLLRRLGMAV